MRGDIKYSPALICSQIMPALTMLVRWPMLGGSTRSLLAFCTAEVTQTKGAGWVQCSCSSHRAPVPTAGLLALQQPSAQTLTSDSQVIAVQAPISGGSRVMSLEWSDRWSRRRRLETVSGSVEILLECRSGGIGRVGGEDSE